MADQWSKSIVQNKKMSGHTLNVAFMLTSQILKNVHKRNLNVGVFEDPFTWRKIVPGIMGSLTSKYVSFGFQN